ncbi:MAG: DUF881 domain-containing protein [Nocardioides sp.]|uniref:DUF881 domain-containing protein n=1 Tax=Nocardioides sp. TaxID=35761 RepID=UPI0039E545F5
MTEPRSAAQLPARVTTPLLALITQQSMDEDYELVARKRAAAPSGDVPGPPRRQRHLGTVAVVAAFGVLIAVAAVQTARNADVTSAGREQLISRIAERRDAVAGEQERIADLRASNAAADIVYDRLGSQLATLQQRNATLATAAGWASASGSGVRYVVTDSTAGNAGGLVRDSDLALLVNGLWQAGARAISVNGQRLTALSSLRNSADVIRVYGVSSSPPYSISLSPPYVVEAIGDAERLRSGLRGSTSGKHLQGVVNAVGLGLTVQNVESLQLPAAQESRMTLRYAQRWESTSDTSAQEAP